VNIENIKVDISNLQTELQGLANSYNEREAQMKELETEFNKLRGERDEIGLKFREQNAVLIKLNSYLPADEEKKESAEPEVKKTSKKAA
jgi:chromosome segregation ATPase